MAVGIIIHVTVGNEKRTELFTDERIRIGADEVSDLQIHSPKFGEGGLLLEIEYQENTYRIVKFNENLKLNINGKPIRRYLAVSDGDVIEIPETDISFSFFALTSKSSLITTRQDSPQVAQFIEQAAIGAAISPKRDDAKMFLREFVRELSREISWTTKLIVLVLALGFISGILYLGYAFNSEMAQNRRQAQEQNETIRRLQEQLSQTSEQIGQLDKSTKTAIDIVSLAPRLSADYNKGVCLIVGVYDLVDRSSGKTLRYPDPQAFQPDPYEPSPPAAMEDQIPDVSDSKMGLTTEGGGTPVEYDFLGTGFYVGGGYIVTNRHVLQPWEEDDLVKQMMRESGGRARIKRLTIYFPNIPQPFPMKIRQLDYREDLAVGTVDAALLPADIPILPLEAESNAAAVGKTVVSMGYPNGPDRLLAMADDDEARALNARCAGQRQCIINSLAQLKKIVPLTTQGSITDLDARRIVHDAKTAEGGSGAPIFGQNAKVIGVNFGVFTGNNATNMAVPVRFAIDLLKKAGWKSPEESPPQNQAGSTASMNSNTKPVENN
jgi:S1-C subfamily serine protease